jgi:antitoxin component HigA of HigAB toxin-antitoxin module
MKTVATFCLEYHRVFDVGELVKPASPRCPMPHGVYEVIRCIVPSEPNGEAVVCLKGSKTPIPTTTLMSAHPEPEFIDPENDDAPIHQREFLLRQLRFPLRLIRDEEEHAKAIGVRDTLLETDQRSEGVEEYVRSLALLIEAYERSDAPPPPYQTDVEIFEYLLETRGVTAREVARATGIQTSSLSRVRTGQAQFTRAQITALITYFNIEPKVFFRPALDLEEGPTYEQFESLMQSPYLPGLG